MSSFQAVLKDDLARDTEVFSPGWSLEVKKDECGGDDRAYARWVEVMRSRVFQARLSSAFRAFGWCAKCADHRVAGSVVRGKVAALDRDQHADAGAEVSLVGKGFQGGRGGRVQRGQRVGRGRR